MAILGYRPVIDNSQTDFGLATNTLFAKQYEVPEGGAVLTGFGVIAANRGGLRLGLYANTVTNGQETPGELLAYSATFTASGTVSSTKAERTLAVAWTKQGNNRLVLPPGKVWIAWYATAADAIVQYNATGTSMPRVRGIYTGATMPNPWVLLDRSSARESAVWIDYTPNSAPTITSATPADGATAQEVAPAFTLNYADTNIAAGDGIEQLRVTVTDTVTGALVARTAVITGADQTDGGITWLWDGGSLVRGRLYTWTAEIADRAGSWSTPLPVRSLTISASNAAGAVDVTTASPTGKQDPGSALYTAGFVAKWSHPSATAMATVQLRLVINGQVVQTSGEIARSAANGGTWSAVSVATAGFTLLPGTAYEWQARGRASGATAWSDWSELVPFATNAPASTPSQLYPAGAIQVTAPPRLSWRCADPDLDDVPGVDVWGEVKVYNSAGATVANLTNIATIDPNDLTLMYVDLTGTQIAAAGTYTWEARNWDRSAGASGYSAWSPIAAFTYSPAPVVTISNSVSQTQTTLSPAISFSVANSTMTQFEVQVAEYLSATPFFSSGPRTVTGSPSSFTYTMPAGWLENDGDYQVTAIVTTATGTGTSAPKRITMALPAAEALDGIGLNTIFQRRDFDETSVRVEWKATSIDQQRFVGYAIWRGSAKGRPLAIVREPGRTSWVDHHAPGNRNLTYYVAQLKRSNANGTGDVLQSTPQAFEARVELRTPVLVSVTDPVNVRCALGWMTDGLTWGFTRPAQTYTTWGSEGKPLAVTAPVNYGQRTATVSVSVRTDSRGTLEEHFRDIEEAAASGHVFSFREGNNRMFCRVASWSASRGGFGQRDVQLELEEVDYTEGVALPK